MPELRDFLRGTLEPLLRGPGGKATADTSLSELRNRMAHGGGLSPELAERLLEKHAQRFEDAMRELDRAASVEPNNPLLRSIRAIVMFYRGEVDQAAALLREVLSANPNLHGVRPFLAICLSKLGDHEAARAELNESVRRTASVDPDIAYAVASVYALEGNGEEAFDWLHRSVALGNENKFLFEHDPNLTGLRNDQRWADLMGRMAR